MRFFTAISFVLAAAVLLAQGQGELTAAQARVHAQQHALAYFGMSLDLGSARADYENHGRHRRAYWQIVSARSEYWIDVDAADGSFRGFVNNLRMHQQWRGNNRTGHEMFATLQDWRSHLLALGRHLGLPLSATLGTITWKHDGQVKDANTAGYVGAHFLDANGRALAVINCDPQDGTLVMFIRED